MTGTTGVRAVVIALAALLAACAGPSKTLPPAAPAGSVRLARVSFAELPGFGNGNERALAAFRRSCSVLQTRATDAPMSGAGYAGTAGDWRGVCAAAAGTGRADFFSAHFTPYQLLGSAGLFTGYFEPEIKGSRTAHGPFQTPVYGVPADLVRADLGLFLPKLKGEHISGRVRGQRLVPYPPRAAIETNGIKNAPVLFYTDDPIAFFFLQIQGSGRVVFQDGTLARVAYAGENGQPYTAIGRVLIADGVLSRENVSLQSIRAWLRAHPEQAAGVMQTNQSYIFFKKTPLGDASLGSKGAMGVALTPMASLAVDPRVNALGAPFFVAADGADPVHRLLIAQDVGGAIRGPVRGDIFFGFGPEALARAGTLKADGKLFVLLPDNLAARIGKGGVFGP